MIIEFLSKTDSDAEYGKKYLVSVATLKLLANNFNLPGDNTPAGILHLSGIGCDSSTLVHVADCKIIDGNIPSNWSCTQEYREGLGIFEFTIGPSKWLTDSLWEYSFFNELDDNTFDAKRCYKEEVLLHWLECGRGLIECPFDPEDDPFVKDVIAKYYQEQKRKSELTSRRNAYDIAEAMIKDRLSIEIIARYTGFSEEDIVKMQKHPGLFNDGYRNTSL